MHELDPPKSRTLCLAGKELEEEAEAEERVGKYLMRQRQYLLSLPQYPYYQTLPRKQRVYP